LTGPATPNPASPAAPSLRQRAVRGAAWWIGITPFQKGIALASNVILAALLSPAIFGVMALAEVVHRGVKMFSDIGIRPALIQNRREDADFLNTAWTLQLLRGGGVWLVASLLAWPMARFYRESILIGLVPVVALSSVLGGFQSTSLAMLNRRLHEKPRALLSLAETLLSRAAMIGVALLWPSAWALAAGSIAGGLFMTTASHTLLPGIRNRFTWDREAAGTLIRFGQWIFLGSIITFFAREIDKLLLGKLVIEHLDALGLLGVYVIARRFAGMSRELMAPLGAQLALPILSEIARDDRANYAGRVRRFRRLMLWPALVLCLGVGLLAPAFFGFLYDERYAAATWMAPLIVLGAWVGNLNVFAERAVLALGKPRPLTLASGINLAASTAGALLGFYGFGLVGFILGLVAGSVVMHGYVLAKLTGYGVNLWGQDLRFTGLFLALTGVGQACLWQGPELAPAAPPGVMTAVFPGLLWACAAAWAARIVLPEVWKGR